MPSGSPVNTCAVDRDADRVDLPRGEGDRRAPGQRHLHHRAGARAILSVPIHARAVDGDTAGESLSRGEGNECAPCVRTPPPLLLPPLDEPLSLPLDEPLSLPLDEPLLPPLDEEPLLLPLDEPLLPDEPLVVPPPSCEHMGAGGGALVGEHVQAW